MFDKPKKYGDDAGLQAANWLSQAVHHIDERFGVGYAKLHPELTAAMVKASALDYHAGMLSEAIEGHGIQLSQS